MYHYTKIDGTYNLVDEEGETLFSTKEICVGYSDSPDCGVVMHKHGSPVNVEKWLGDTREKLIGAGHLDMANEFKMIKSFEFPVDELNRVLDTTGYLGIYLGRCGIDICKRRK